MAIFNSYVSLPNGTPQSSNLDWDFHEINHQAIGVSPFMEALIYSQLQTVPQSHSPTVQHLFNSNLCPPRWPNRPILVGRCRATSVLAPNRSNWLMTSFKSFITLAAGVKSYNVGETIHIAKICVPFPVMGGLWHCFTHM